LTSSASPQTFHLPDSSLAQSCYAQKLAEVRSTEQSRNDEGS